MIISPKHLWPITLLAALLMIAAQCGAQPAGSPAEQGLTKVNQEHEHEEASEHEHELETAAELAPVSLGAGEKLNVIATTSIVADIVSNVGGDLIDLTMLLPPGVDPHTFEPTPGDLAAVVDAHVIFANGMGLEAFLDEMIENAGGQAAIIHLSDGLEPRHSGEEDEHEHNHEDEEGRHHHEGSDPHTWTSPANAIIFTHNIEHALSALDPANAEVYQANAETYKAELEALDAWVKSQINSIPPNNRKLVTDHTTFGYYADRYGLEQVGAVIPAFSTATEPSARSLVELEEAIKKYKVKAIFVGVSVNPALSKQVAADTGTRLVTLYTGSLGPEGSGVETYLDYIRYNTEAIVEALK